MKTLKNWSVTFGELDPYKAPEQYVPHLQGYVYGHDLHSDGTRVITSRIVCAKDGLVITGSGNSYEILQDEVDPEYEKKFPNAFERLFANG